MPHWVIKASVMRITTVVMRMPMAVGVTFLLWDLLWDLVANLPGHLDWDLNWDVLAALPFNLLGHLVALLYRHILAFFVIAMPMTFFLVGCLACFLIYCVLVGVAILLVLCLVVGVIFCVTFVFIHSLVYSFVSGVA